MLSYTYATNYVDGKYDSVSRGSVRFHVTNHYHGTQNDSKWNLSIYAVETNYNIKMRYTTKLRTSQDRVLYHESCIMQVLPSSVVCAWQQDLLYQYHSQTTCATEGFSHVRYFGTNQKNDKQNACKWGLDWYQVGLMFNLYDFGFLDLDLV